MRLLRRAFPSIGMPQWSTLAMSYESARDVCQRKGYHMVWYLRERRDPTGMKAFHRSKFLTENRNDR